MTIVTADRHYRILACLEDGEAFGIYLCEEGEGEQEGDREPFRLIEIRDQAVLRRSMEFLYTQVRRKEFSDLKECFVSEERLYLVFACGRGRKLSEQLDSERLSLKERLLIGKNIMERMVLLSMPASFQTWCLRPERIRISASLDVTFEYVLEDLGAYESYGIKEVQTALARIIALLFEEELKRQVLSEAEDLIGRLRTGSFRSYVECYGAYLDFYRQAETSGKEQAVPGTWPFRLWERLKGLFKPLKRLAVLAMLLLALLYMIETLVRSMEPAPVETVFEQIGTLDIR